MAKLNFDFLFKDLEGKEIKDADAGKMLGNALATSNKGDAVKTFEMAMKIYNHIEFEVDKSDKQMLVDFVKSNDGLTNLVKAQLLDIIQKE